MLDLIYHKPNSLIMTLVDGSFFKKMSKTITWEKKVISGITIMKL